MKSQSKLLRLTLAAAFILLLSGQTGAGERLEPGGSYYFDAFDPTQKPWNPGYSLNYEEVFKNYLFFEVVVAPSGREITVNRYIRNNKADSEQYRLNPDGSLSRISGD